MRWSRNGNVTEMTIHLYGEWVEEWIVHVPIGTWPERRWNGGE